MSQSFGGFVRQAQAIDEQIFAERREHADDRAFAMQRWKRTDSDFDMTGLLMADATLLRHVATIRQQFGQHLQFLTRNMAKYYFQPNQRSTPEMLLMERVPGLAIRTPNFA